MQYCEIFSVNVLGNMVCFKLIGPRNNVVSTDNTCFFTLIRGRFFGDMTSAENSVSEPPNLKILGGRIPPDSPKGLVPSALARVPCKPFYMPPLAKKS